MNRPAKEEYVVRLFGLPFGCSIEEIQDFFRPLATQRIRLLPVTVINNETFATAYVVFDDRDAAASALDKDMRYIRYRYIRVSASSAIEMEDKIRKVLHFKDGPIQEYDRPRYDNEPHSTSATGSNDDDVWGRDEIERGRDTRVVSSYKNEPEIAEPSSSSLLNVKDRIRAAMYEVDRQREQERKDERQHHDDRPEKEEYFFEDCRGVIQGPFDERTMLCFYRGNHLWSSMRIEIRGELFTLAELIALNGPHCPFLYPERKKVEQNLERKLDELTKRMYALEDDNANLAGLLRAQRDEFRNYTRTINTDLSEMLRDRPVCAEIAELKSTLESMQESLRSKDAEHTKSSELQTSMIRQIKEKVVPKEPEEKVPPGLWNHNYVTRHIYMSFDDMRNYTIPENTPAEKRFGVNLLLVGFWFVFQALLFPTSERGAASRDCTMTPSAPRIEFTPPAASYSNPPTYYLDGYGNPTYDVLDIGGVCMYDGFYHMITLMCGL